MEVNTKGRRQENKEKRARERKQGRKMFSKRLREKKDVRRREGTGCFTQQVVGGLNGGLLEDSAPFVSCCLT